MGNFINNNDSFDSRDVDPNGLVSINYDYSEPEVPTNNNYVSNNNNNSNGNSKTMLFIGGGVILLLLLILLLFLLFGKKEYQVTFNSDGGNAVASQKVDKGDLAVKPEPPTKEGFVFLSWNYENQVFDFNTEITKDIELVANWQEVEGEYYVVTFNTGGGSDIATQVVTTSNRLVKPEDPVKEGYTFKSWELNDKKFDFASDVKEDIVLVATWERNETESESNKNTNTNNNNTNKNNNSNNNNNTANDKDTDKNTDKNTSSGSSSSANTSTNVSKKYGDANLDGVINAEDAQLVLQYVSGNKTLTGQAKKNADINGDGKINNVDAQLILGYAVKLLVHDVNKPLTNYVMYGDADENGVVDARDQLVVLNYVAGTATLTGKAKQNADINKDGKVNKADALLINAVAGRIYKLSNAYSPLVNYRLYGDAFMNGEITGYDVTVINNHINGTAKLTGQGLKNADINKDGKVNKIDYWVVLGVVKGKFSCDLISPVKSYILYGDATNDGIVNMEDVNAINNHNAKIKLLTGQGLKNADTNGDGKVNANDINPISQYSAKIKYGDVLPLNPAK